MNGLSGSEDIANCLMLLSKVGRKNDKSSRVFACKTCNREFQSFQALGGHRASHKKHVSYLNTSSEEEGDRQLAVTAPKKHKCSYCGLEFGLGQALGGHMRRHRSNSGNSGRDDGNLVTRCLLPMPVMMKKCYSGKRVVCLDLNLTPLENDLMLVLEKVV